jgi:hypothetical protein
MEALNEQMMMLEKQMEALRAEKRKMSAEDREREEAERKRIEAERKAEEQRKIAEEKALYKKSFKYHIDKEVNRLMIEAMDEFSSNTMEGSYSIEITRPLYTDPEAFDKYLNEVVSDYEERITDYDNGIYHFNFSVSQLYDDVDDEDKITRVWEVEVEWDSNIQNPFEEMIDRELDKD